MVYGSDWKISATWDKSLLQVSDGECSLEETLSFSEGNEPLESNGLRYSPLMVHIKGTTAMSSWMYSGNLKVRHAVEVSDCVMTLGIPVTAVFIFSVHGFLGIAISSGCVF